MLRIGDTIEYLVDVNRPPTQKGIRGQTKIVGRDIEEWPANYLFRGGQVRIFNPDSPLQLEEEKSKKGPDGPGKKSEPDSAAGTKVKPERRTKTNGRQSNSKTNQASVPESEKSDSKGRTRDRRN